MKEEVKSPVDICDLFLNTLSTGKKKEMPGVNGQRYSMGHFITHMS